MNYKSDCGRSIREVGLFLPENNIRFWTGKLPVFLAAAILAGMSGNVLAQSGSCLLEDTVLTCSGDFPDGIILVVDASSPPITALTLNGITSDIDVVNQVGVLMINTIGGRITLNSGAVDDTFLINTTGAGAHGIFAQSTGDSGAFSLLPSLGIFVPAGPAGSGGAVDINNFGDIVTAGNGAHGILAMNQVGSYHPLVVASLESFDPSSVTYGVISVEGDAAAVGQQVQGSNGGTFTINADGSYDFDPGTDFDNLNLGPEETVETSVNYSVNANGQNLAEGVITIVYFFNQETQQVDTRVEVDFAQYGVGSIDGNTSVLPDMQSYVDALLADAGVAGTGDAIGVSNEGTITTHGDGAQGVAAVTVSGTGRAGKDSCTFCSAPSAGGPGADGGTVAIDNRGEIATNGAGSAGIFVSTRGGTGGEGGYGGPWYFGRTGGEGGRGGDILIAGDGSIQTTGYRSIGIFVTSEGGIGGNGGSGSGATGGGNGGSGGDAGNVGVDSNMTITTAESESHGIWARSIGGSGGTGGSNGWLGTSSGGSGGEASDGGEVFVRSGGQVSTAGDFSYGVFAQSVGGFGGDGGNAAGIFVSWGGHGNSAGSGGIVNILNDLTGSIFTEGEYAHAIFGQSIGGGGGSGGSGGAIVGIGGGARAGGHGGVVNILNAGEIETQGQFARGIYAQSIGGGGGDGGDSGGVVGIGGAGSEASHGGAVDVINRGEIRTSGDDAEAVYIQSIGGGGGSGGASGGAVSIGGSGGGGGNGGEILFRNTGEIETFGDSSIGVFIQSIGGGGGSGAGSGGLVSIGGSGLGGGIGGNIVVDNLGTIATCGHFADGLFIQSIGGGGGKGAASGGAVSIGGSGAGGGQGGDLTIGNSGSIYTLGTFSRGIYGQSIGGGGGDGRPSGAFFVSIGGSGGSAGAGGAVSIDNIGTIATAGNFSQGIYGQSVGGGGGSAGGSGAWFASLGGDGGNGGTGDGGLVTVTNSGLISTAGCGSQAIFAQSVGGGGGNGAGSGAWFTSIGGTGGMSGDGGAVVVNNSGQLLTERYDSSGIFAQSIGGGGGNGAGGGAWFASLGGEGGAGGSGGDVSVLNESQIVTLGDWSHSIFAQSIGGGGGSGGGTGAAYVAIGGDGGPGSNGGNVTVDNGGELVTVGIGSQGIHAESIGGGGGNGAGAGSLNVTIGGSGAIASDGGDVLVSNTGHVTTFGDLGHSIYAVSIGGGGGSASTAGSALFTLGGSGASGGTGGLVTVNNSEQLASFGDGASGIFAQSLGGGGGNGGGAITVTAGPNVAFGMAIGGSAGNGAIGDMVTVNNDGNIFTQGANSHGIFAQSVGGGGGTGGNAFSFSGTAAVIPEIPFAINASVAIGGSGGSGGDGGVVNITHTGDITTAGFRSGGIIAQSIGGGGGDGGNATSVTLNINTDVSGTVAIGGSGDTGGNGDIVDVDSSGTIITAGAHANGILAQSIGGGGGSGGDSTTVSIDLDFPTSPEDLIPSPGMSFDVSIGGSGAAGGDGGAVTVVSDDAIVTEGVFAAGIMAQSIGGGGGAGGDARTFQFDISANPTDLVPYLDLVGFESTLVFGGSGGAAGNGGTVGVTNNADIYTQGEFGYGVVAQSVGGGGGAGGNALTFQLDTTDLLIPEIPILDEITGLTNLSMVLEGSGGGAGDGGDVALENNGNILTEGDFAHGVFGQSVAGGGGLAGIVNAQGATTTLMGQFAQGILSLIDGSGVGFAGSVGGSGTAGTVLLTNTGDISTTGSAAHGIFAQSAAGLGSADTVDVTTSGILFARGVDSFGIVAQSVGGAGNGNISVNILDGYVVGGSGSGGGVLMSDGADNVLINAGVITSLLGADGNAIISTGGNDSIENSGTVTGSIHLGAGSNALDNYGWLNTGSTIHVGAGNLVFNDGVLAPGGVMNVMTTDLTGDFMQSGAGTLLFDLQFNFGADIADFLSISGATILDGTLALSLVDTGSIMPGTHEHVLVSSVGGIANNGISLNVAPSAVVSFELFSADPTEQSLRYIVDFAPTGMHSNYTALGEHINQIQLAGGSGLMKRLTASIVAQPDIDMLTTAYTRLSPHGYWASQASRVFSSLNFDESMHSCPIREGDYRFSREGDCTWINLSERDVDHAASPGTLGANERATVLSIGAQKALSEHWHGGIALGYEHSTLNIPRFTERDGYALQIGGILKGRFGAHDITFSASAGNAQFDTRRYVSLPTPDVIAAGDRDIGLFAAHTRYAFNFAQPNWYLRPSLDFGYTAVNADRLQERYGGAANLTVESQDHDFVTARAALQIGGERVVNGTLLRPYARVGLTRFLTGDSLEITATLAGAPDAVAPFTQWNDIGDQFTDAALGLDLLWSNDITLRLGYEAQFGDNWDADALSAKILFDF